METALSLLCFLLFGFSPVFGQRHLLTAKDGANVFILQDRFLAYKDIDLACKERGLQTWFISSKADFNVLQRALNVEEFNNTLIWVHLSDKRITNKRLGAIDKVRTRLETIMNPPLYYECGGKLGCPMLTRVCPDSKKKYGHWHQVIRYDCAYTAACLCTGGILPIPSKTSTTTNLPDIPAKIPTTSRGLIDLSPTTVSAQNSTQETFSGTTAKDQESSTNNISLSASLSLGSTMPAEKTRVNVSSTAPETTTTTATTDPFPDKKRGNKLCMCPPTARFNISMIELGEIMDKEREILAVDIAILSSTRRKLESAKDDRMSSFLISIIAMTVMGFLYVLILFNDVISIGFKVHRCFQKRS